ncbi:siderophore-interacting protein [Parafrankia discariae]|uniref:siderophore-interacting protein n=1 Tax=Parafrankia discariae TaxID=365528 RepID=UPI0003607BBD|nr:siderophore-interacting protein [Parafrankia discariae]
MATTGRTRPVRSQAVLTVQEKSWISPGIARVVLGGPGFDAYNDNTFTDKYVKIFFADPAHGLRPPYDLVALRAEQPEKLPATRTYTVRWADADTRRLAIDFIVHGDEGVAGPWAARAEAGDQLVLSGAGGAYRPDPAADWHLLAGDETVIPSATSALAAMPAEATGTVILLVDSAKYEVPLPRPDGVSLRWLYRETAAAGSDPLVAALRELAWPAGTPQVFVHGERGTVKAARRLLTDERDVPRERLSISAYWATGRAEDRFQAEKREPVGQI